MPYIYTNKKTQKIRLFGSLVVLSEETGIKIDNLYKVFSRQKLNDFENNDCKIHKRKLERSEHKWF